MANPTASFVITARDATAAAIASADRGLKQLGRSVTSTRSLMAGFGVLLSGRALLGWVTNAVKAADATGEHAKQIKAAQEAMAGMKKASDELAVSVGMQLTPAFAGLGKVLTGLNAFFFNADTAPFAKDIADVEEKIREMRKHGIDTGIGELLYSKEDQATIAKLQADLAALIEKQNRAFGNVFDTATLRQTAAMRQSVAGMRRIGDDFDRLGLKRPNIAMDFLDEDGLQEVLVTAREMTVDELMKPFPAAEVRKLFAPIKDEAFAAARFVGDNFRDAFTGWLIDGELKFKDFLRRMAIQLGTSAFFNMLGSAFPGVPILGRLFGGSRASGGSAREGMVYKVHPGEAFFSPGMDGHVGATGGGSIVIHQTNTFHGGDRREQMAAIAENNRRLKQEIKAEIRDARNRGRPV